MIIVVGARIAGSTLSGLLARDGEQVLLLERQSLPGTTVSIAVFWPDTLAIFDKFGFGDALDSAGYPRVSFMSFEFAPGVRISGRVPRSFGREWGYAIRREALDPLLLEHVRGFANVDVRENFRVTSLVRKADRVVGVRGHGPSGTAEEIHADLVVGADGRSSFIARNVDAPKYLVRRGRTCVYYAHYSNVEPFTSEPSYISYLGSGRFPYYAFTQDAEGGLTGIGVEAPAAAFKQFQLDPEATLAECIQNVGQLRARLRKAERETAITGLVVPDMFYRKPYGDGWALVGDAGLFMDPITGQGFNDATTSAMWLAQAIRRWRRGAPWEKTALRYKTIRDRRTKSNFKRAYDETDFQAITSDWKQRWYAWMSEKPERSFALRQMLSNGIPPEQFYTPWRLAVAYLRHQVLYSRKTRSRDLNSFVG